MGSALSFNYLAHHLVLIEIYLILALSLNLINGYAGMFSLGHQGFWAVGAYAGGMVVASLTDLPGAVALPLSLVAGMAAATLAGLIIGVPCLRLRGDYLAIATLGFAEIIRVLLNNFEFLGASRGLTIPRIVEKSPAKVTFFLSFYMGLGALCVLLTIVVCRNLIRSSHGRAIVSLREDEVASQLLGVNITRYKVLTFLIGSAFAGLAGALYANFLGYINPKDFEMMAGIIILLMVVLGGMGSMSGTVLATFILYSVQRVLTLGMFGQVAKDRWQFFFAMLLILIMILAPQGLFGNKELSDSSLYRRAFGRWRKGAIQAGGEARQVGATGGDGVDQENRS